VRRGRAFELLATGYALAARRPLTRAELIMKENRTNDYPSRAPDQCWKAAGPGRRPAPRHGGPGPEQRADAPRKPLFQAEGAM